MPLAYVDCDLHDIMQVNIQVAAAMVTPARIARIIPSYSPGDASVHLYLVYGSLAARESASSNSISIGLIVSLDSLACPTDRQTHRQTLPFCQSKFCQLLHNNSHDKSRTYRSNRPTSRRLCMQCALKQIQLMTYFIW